MIDTDKYQPARQNMKLVALTLRSLTNKLHILARQADIFGITYTSLFVFGYVSHTFLHSQLLLYNLLESNSSFHKLFSYIFPDVVFISRCKEYLSTAG
jgi:hypothetical protein